MILAPEVVSASDVAPEKAACVATKIAIITSCSMKNYLWISALNSQVSLHCDDFGNFEELRFKVAAIKGRTPKLS